MRVFQVEPFDAPASRMAVAADAGELIGSSWHSSGPPYALLFSGERVTRERGHEPLEKGKEGYLLS